MRWILLLILIFSYSQRAVATFRFRDADPQRFVNSILSFMSYSAIPDLASSSLSITNASSGNPSISMTQLGGGFTTSKSTPIYLEGAAAYSRYDPRFVATEGTETRETQMKWNSGVLQMGVGYDFPLAEYLVIRPIFNLSGGVIVSDLEVGAAFIGSKLDLEDADFLDGGSITMGGMGASLMLDYEYQNPDMHDIDAELRYSYIHLQSMGGARSVSGYSDSSTLNFYYRFRAPVLDWRVLYKPFRYVLESSYSHYFGDQAGILGFDDLATVGLGLELDSSNYDFIITRTRLVGRYMFGPNVRGYSIGLACSF